MANVSCPKCEAPVPANARFCPQCGHEMKTTPEKKCNKCGAKNPASASFCKECGAQLPKRVVAPSASDKLQKQYMYIFGAGFLAVIVVLIYYYAEFVKPLENKVNQTQFHQHQEQQQQQTGNMPQAPPPPSAATIQAAIQDAKQHPDNADFQIQAGNLLFDSGKFDEAVPYYKKALQLDPNNANVMVDLGVCYYNLGDFDGAEKQFELALQVEPDHINALYNLGIIAIHKGEMEKLKQAWSRLTQVAPQSQQAQQAMRYLENIHRQAEQPSQQN